MQQYTTPFKAHSVPFKASGVFYGVVVAVNGKRLDIKVPRMTGDAVFKNIEYADSAVTDTPSAGELLLVSFLEGNKDDLVVLGRVRSSLDRPDVYLTSAVENDILSFDGENWVPTADPIVHSLTVKQDADPYPQVKITDTGSMTFQSPKKTPFVGDHIIGAVGYGHDSQIYIERNQNVSSILTLQMDRPDSVAAIEPAITSTTAFPVTSGSITVADATEFPLTSGGPYNLGTALVRLPSFTDDFTRANSTTTLGSPWSVIGSTAKFGISSNSAYCHTGDGTTDSIAYVDAGGVHEVSCDIASSSSANSNGSGIILASDGTLNNYISIKFSNTFGTWNVNKVVGGVATFLFNSGFMSPFINIRATVKASGYLYVWFNQNAATVANVGTGFSAYTKCGIVTTAATPDPSMKWDNFVVRTTAPCTWTGKSGNTLTGFTCTGLTGTSTSSWNVVFSDGTAASLVSAYDGAGAPIWNLRSYGGQHTTDNVTMGSGLSGQVGMSFASLGQRNRAGLVFYGDNSQSGAWDSTTGTYLRRKSPYQIQSGGRITIQPTPLTNYLDVTTSGSATAPWLALGNDDTGLYWTTTGTNDTIHFSSDGVETGSINANGLTVVNSVILNAGGTRKVTTDGTELILEQTGDAYGRSSLNLRNRNGAGGAIFYTRNAAGGAMGVVDFGFDSGLLYQSNIRMEARPDEYGTIKVGPATGTPFNRTNVTEVQFVDNPTAVGGVAASFYFCSNKLATVVRVGKFGVGADDPTGQIHIKASSASTIGSIVQGSVSQTANLSEWQNSAGSIVAKVTSSGELQATVIDGGSA